MVTVPNSNRYTVFSRKRQANKPPTTPQLKIQIPSTHSGNTHSKGRLSNTALII